MPVVAEKVMHMLGDPRTTNTMLGETLASDQSLASRILQMANSPFFGTRQKIASVSSAVFVLGHSALRSLVITVCTKGLFKNSGLMEEKLWEHALATAVASRKLAERTTVMNPDEGFIAGLMHDIGKTSLAVVYHDEYAALFQKIYESDMLGDEGRAMEKEEFGFDHCEIGSRVLTKWRLPATLSRIARHHHTNNIELINREESPKALAMVGLANLVAARVGLGRAAPNKQVDVVSNIFAEVLEMSREDILQIIEQTLMTYKESRSQFDLA